MAFERFDKVNVSTEEDHQGLKVEAIAGSQFFAGYLNKIAVAADEASGEVIAGVDGVFVAFCEGFGKISPQLLKLSYKTLAGLPRKSRLCQLSVVRRCSLLWLILYCQAQNHMLKSPYFH